MKTITVILSLALCVAVAFADTEAENSPLPVTEIKDDDYDVNQALTDIVKGKGGVPLWHKLLELMQEMKKHCPSIEKDFDKEFQSVRECAEEIKINNTLTICQAVRMHFHDCNKPVRDLLSRCMPPKSKELPELISKMAVAVFDEACHSTVEQVIELMNPCQFATKFITYESCKAVKTEIDSFTEKFPTKQFICSLIPKVKACSLERHTASCSNPVSKKAFVHLHEAIERATKEICANPSKNEIS